VKKLVPIVVHNVLAVVRVLALADALVDVGNSVKISVQVVVLDAQIIVQVYVIKFVVMRAVVIVH
jgi:hypothetical protein